ncbi:Putative zn(2)-C6 fungal-type DNA-binding domain, fungal transcription factor [Septoria linicola]|uniref:Zn(2)-C6 fungal-type DNA-binding domain, fungal transcription factor n=1 Tax=Septoria linicola TaxID=215465 RepID=A0A9Q9ATY1_9PEZI|nr:Putative zn(2)-C6 fungal-type DNA-binding domain, fungal transcription factor [Septoria linicola]
MEGHYPPHMYYPNGYPPTMPPEAYQQPPRLHPVQNMPIEAMSTYADYEDSSRAMLPPQGTSQRSRRRQPLGAEHVKHRRTRSGCYTCRQRRVKCDESHPICDRCRKGKRECTYPGDAASTPATSRTKGSRRKGSPAGSSPSGSDLGTDENEPLSAVQDVDEDELDDEDPLSATSDRKPSDTSSVQPEQSTSPSTESSVPVTRPRPTRTSSRQSLKPGIAQNPRWNALPKDVKFYLRFHQQHMSHHHYAFKYDGGDFLKTTFLEIAMNDGSAALLYAIVAFAAYHHAVAEGQSDISAFLSYYNRSIFFLQQSLKKQRHSIATLLTILQLATIEEFLGDWVNLQGHQKAAYQILTDLFTPQTILQDETRRKIITWYIRFDLFAGMMSGAATTLDREWFAASAEFYKRQTKDKPKELGARFEYYFASTRLLATDIAKLFADRAKDAIDDKAFGVGIDTLSQELAEFGQIIGTAFTDPSCFVSSFANTLPPGEEDLFGFRDPKFLYSGELATMNFVLLDHWAVELMFKYQLGAVLGQSPSPELTQIAMKKSKMFDAIQHGREGGPTAILGCQASLGIMSLFLPKDQQHTRWCQRKFASIEQLGYIYPETLRKRMSGIWSEDVARWWLPNDEGYPATIRTIREFVEYRATRPTDAWTTGISNMSGIFRGLNLEEYGFSDDMKSVGTESVGSAVSPLVHESSPGQP